jgi:hypothetical protein
MGGRNIVDFRLSAIGAIAGGAVGYLYRPSAFMVGQLPFQHVITRGRSLKGLDQVLVPFAEKSFNYMLAGVVIGAVLGFVLKLLLDRKGDGGNG